MVKIITVVNCINVSDKEKVGGEENVDGDDADETVDGADAVDAVDADIVDGDGEENINGDVIQELEDYYSSSNRKINVMCTSSGIFSEFRFQVLQNIPGVIFENGNFHHRKCTENN